MSGRALKIRDPQAVGRGRVRVSEYSLYHTVDVFDGTEFVSVSRTDCEEEAQKIAASLRSALRDAILCERRIQRNKR